MSGQGAAPGQVKKALGPTAVRQSAAEKGRAKGKAAPARAPHTAPTEYSRTAILAFILSAFGFLLIPAVLGIWYGRKAVEETTAGKRDGGFLAKAAVYIGWAWILFWVLGIITFLWILL